MRTPRASERRGTVLPMTAAWLMFIFFFVSLAIDIGVLTVGRTQCQAAADAAALAGTRLLNNRPGTTSNNGKAALEAARATLIENELMNANFQAAAASNIRLGVYDYSTSLSRFVAPSVGAGTYDANAFLPGATEASPGTRADGKSWTAVEVNVSVTQPTFFSRVLGIGTLPNGARALAVHRPRDIAFVLDYSGSMGFGSAQSWPYYESDNRQSYQGLHNPDPNFPLFGHYGRYGYYTVDNPVGAQPTNSTEASKAIADGATLAADADPKKRPNPFRRTTPQYYYGAGNNETYALAPNNHTVESAGGPPMVEGTYTDNGAAMLAEGFVTAIGNPATVGSGTKYIPAFSWVPTQSSGALSFTGYNALKAATDQADPISVAGTGTYKSNVGSGVIATPAPPHFNIQADANSIPYVGDKAPRTDGGHGPVSSATYDWADIKANGVGAGGWATLKADNTWTDNWAKSVQEYLGVQSSGTGSNLKATGRLLIAGTTGVPLFKPLPAGYGATTAAEIDGGDTWANFRDTVWERFGYDLLAGPGSASIAGVSALEDTYRTSTGAWPDTAASIARTVKLKDAGDRFKGYSMGPGYWGKTFFTWPPDPRWGNPTYDPNAASGDPAKRFLGASGKPAPESVSTTDERKDANGNWICDWRLRFFLRGDGEYLDPQRDNVNRILFRTSAGHVLNGVVTAVSGTGNTAANMPGYYRINYAAVMAWLKKGPMVLPENVRAGRYVYYKTMPNDLTGTGTSDDAIDRRFWREYVHYVLGVGQFSTGSPVETEGNEAPNARPDRGLAGVESNFGLSIPAQSDTTVFTPTPGAVSPITGPKLKPYMPYNAQVNRPRAHFWFGPLTWVSFIKYYGVGDTNGFAGTVREAQCWQVKAAMASVLDDVRYNHPNDFCGLTFFAGRGEFESPRAPMSQDWFTLKNALYFRREAVDVLNPKNGGNSNNPVEYRVFNENFAIGDWEKLPNGRGGTDPNTGLAVAYNLLSSSTSLTKTKSVTAGGSTVTAPVYGERGRLGAAKIVLFETDGVPNSTNAIRSSGTGANTFIRLDSTGTAIPTGDLTFTFTHNTKTASRDAARAAIGMTRAICNLTTATPAGHSTPGVQARVYAIGFGDIFEGWGAGGSTGYTAMPKPGQDGHDFLLAIQKYGNTSATTDTTLPARQLISGTYSNRIDLMRDALERIFQSGVQVTLLE